MLKLRYFILFYFIFYIDLCYAGFEIRREYYPDGKLKSETYWLNAKEYGVWKFYYENGVLKDEINKIENTRKEYYKSGNLKTEVFLNKDKTKKIIKHYFEKGALMSVGIFKTKGKLTGLEKHYDEEGNLLYIYRYRDGRIVDIKKIK